MSHETLEDALRAAEERNNQEKEGAEEESTQEDYSPQGETASAAQPIQEEEVGETTEFKEKLKESLKELKEEEERREYSPEEVGEFRMFLDRFGVNESKLSDEEVIQKVERIQKARHSHAQVLSRGRTLDGLDRLLKFVPEGYVGEFKRERPEDISRARALGFEVFKSQKASVISSTGAADGKVRLADQILMIIPEEEYIAAHLAKQDNIQRRRRSREPKKQIGVVSSDNPTAVDPLVPIQSLL